MKQIFRVGQSGFAIDYPESIPVPEDFLKFLDPTVEVSFSYHLQIVKELPAFDGRLLIQRDDLVVYDKDGKEIRYIGRQYEKNFYACYQERDDQHATIYLVENAVEDCRYNVVFTSLLALEKRVLQENSLVLHTSYIEYMGAAILFSAPSGTGKTTQSNLWEEYRMARTINGDRALLSKKDGSWYAGGWPVCGTSKVCRNKELPIQAIVMLSQAKENSAKRLTPMKAFSYIYSQITINRWDATAHNKAMNLIEQLIMEVPVYHLACDISEEAVECLERKLYIER